MAPAEGLNLYVGSLDNFGGVRRGLMLTFLQRNMLFAIGSMVCVFTYLAWKLASLWLAITGFFEIFVSVPISLAIWGLIGNSYMGFLQFMGIFIIM